VQPLDAALLPPLLVAWRADSGGHSGAVHAPLRDRHADGEPVVLEAMATLARAARAGADAVARGDHPTFRSSVDASFDARRSMMALDPRHVEMIDCARAAGAAANYAGSGGAIVAVSAGAAHRARVRAALARISCETLVT
jgi:glucuronokinase